ncbi:MAG: biotin--[acetyl-CoA-carboxylase] ligase [Steroidobacteraceae bacterium]|nr:biotin--[acetyl-CoA-carboxylase] ligase [Gammaproteobacteria bacterium]
MLDRPLAQSLYLALSDGACHSGEALAQHLHVTRSAVWKAMETLRELGLDIDARTHHGYQLAGSPAALSEDLLRQEISTEDSPLLPPVDLRVAWLLDSTNTTLLEEPPLTPGRLSVLFVENQRGGRGRRGRQWQSRLGDSLCFSLAMRFETVPVDLPALPLVIGLSVRQVLRAQGVPVQLKWPNDLVMDHGESGLAKLGGILVELRAEAGGPALVVMGVGINLRLDKAQREEIAREGGNATDLSAEGGLLIERNALASGLIKELRVALAQFAREGFSPWRERWMAADVLAGRSVAIERAGSFLEGVAEGIDVQGALRLRVGERLETLHGGEVSVRPYNPPSKGTAALTVTS